MSYQSDRIWLCQLNYEKKINIARAKLFHSNAYFNQMLNKSIFWLQYIVSTALHQVFESGFFGCKNCTL